MRFSWLIVFGVAVVVAVGLGWQRRVLQQRMDAQRSVARQSQPAREVSSPPTLAARVDRSLDASDETVVAALRCEFEGLKQRVGTSARSRQAAGREPRRLSLLQGAVAAEWWSNAGQDTPAATLESALWAAAGGELTRLAETLTIEASQKDQAAALLGLLPAEFQGRFATAEELVAFLMIKDVPLGSAEVLQQVEIAGDMRISVRLADTEGRRKVVVLSLKQSGPTWRLVVPGDAIERYAAFLQGRTP